MGIIIRQSIISTIITYLGILIAYVNILILMPKYLSLEEVGLQRIVQDIATLMVPLIQIGVSHIVIKFFPQYTNKASYSEFVSFIILFFIASSSLFTVFCIILKPEIIHYFDGNSALVNDYLLYIYGLGILLAMNQLLVTFSFSLKNSVLPNFLKEILLRVYIFIFIILYSIKIITFHQFILLIILAYLLNCIVLMVFVLRKKAFTFSVRFNYIKWVDVQKMITYSLFIILGSSGGLIIARIDSIMITSMLGLQYTAIYSIAFYIAILIDLPKKAIAQIGMPFISEAYKENNYKKIQSIYKKSSINSFIIGCLLFIGIWINIDSVYSLLPKSSIYEAGKLVVLIIGVGKLVEVLLGLSVQVVTLSTYFRINTYLQVLLAFYSIVANYILIPLYGIEGAAVGSATALILINLTRSIILNRKEQLQPLSLQTIKVLGIAIFCLLIGVNFPKLNNIYIDILARSTCVTVIFSSLILWFRPSNDIIIVANHFFEKITGRKK